MSVVAGEKRPAEGELVPVAKKTRTDVIAYGAEVCDHDDTTNVANVVKLWM